MKKVVILTVLLFTFLSGCGENVCYVCRGMYTGKSYDYPTFGGPSEKICESCYTRLFCFECGECHKLIDGDHYTWPVVTSAGSDTGTTKLCKECFDKKLCFEE